MSSSCHGGCQNLLDDDSKGTSLTRELELGKDAKSGNSAVSMKIRKIKKLDSIMANLRAIKKESCTPNKKHYWMPSSMALNSTKGSTPSPQTT